MEIRSHIDRYSPLNWRLRYRVMLFLVLALVLTPAAIFATSDVFTDVPDSNIFHDDINAIYGARITLGTSPGLYSPGLNVTRDQMAAFLHRGLPRVAYNFWFPGNLTDLFQDVGVVTIDTGGAPGGTGFVKLDASLTAYGRFLTGCPCWVVFNIQQDGSANQSINSGVIANNMVGDTPGDASGSVSWVVAVPTASKLTFRLKARQATGTATVQSTGTFTALYIPFGSTGGSTLAAQTGATAGALDQREPEAQLKKDANPQR